MLVLSRKENQSILIDGDIRITIVKVKGKSASVGIEAPGQVSIVRAELERWDDSPAMHADANAEIFDELSQLAESGALI